MSRIGNAIKRAFWELGLKIVQIGLKASTRSSNAFSNKRTKLMNKLGEKSPDIAKELL